MRPPPYIMVKNIKKINSMSKSPIYLNKVRLPNDSIINTRLLGVPPKIFRVLGHALFSFNKVEKTCAVM